ncbi:mannose-1-phosphate guanylyltransferase [Actinomyces minihominis]|uniref:mannose-1-phosphate guanylyltransferase n=1 Tax=Actinomyces minihominis TaxID=2002838 RepID=UPI000C07E72A|nr:sugar phosphate nucleotidyltransferase [Actinomyces minihominis]
MQSGQSQVDSTRRLHSIIPAGGSGTRLWPLSRAGHPKFLLDLLGRGTTLLEATALRLAPISASITVVTGQAHADAVKAQLSGLQKAGLLDANLDVDVVVEPSGRDSMPAIGLAAALIARRYGDDAIVGSFAADHAIGDEDAFRATVLEAAGAARAGYICTIGIQPTFPSTAFGYIKPTDKTVSEGASLVAEFVEKPPLSIAERYVEAGYLWNAGMFVMGAGAVLGHLRNLQPEMADRLQQMAQVWDQQDLSDVVATIDVLWQEVPRIAIDHAVAEPVAALGGVAVVAAPAAVGWSDVGDFEALAEMGAVEAGESGETEIVRISAPGSFAVSTSGRLVAIVGIPDAVVIDTEDALLVTVKENAQQVKDVVDFLKHTGRTKYI